MYRCSICGKEFRQGATIIGTVILCPECANEYDELIADITSEILEKKLKGEQIDINSVMKKYQDRLEKFNMIKGRMKMTILANILRLSGST